jgi:hypothetical protein
MSIFNASVSAEDKISGLSTMRVSIDSPRNLLGDVFMHILLPFKKRITMFISSLSTIVRLRPEKFTIYRYISCARWKFSVIIIQSVDLLKIAL